MKKIIIIFASTTILIAGIFIIQFLNLLNIGINPLMTKEQANKRFEISFSYKKLLLVASSQYAFWIEDIEGNYIDTLYVTRFTAQGGFRNRPKSIPLWVFAAKPAEMSSIEIDAISGATPRSGDYHVYWDFKDYNGNLVTDKEYRYFIEATMYNDDNVLYSGIITIGDDAWIDTPVPVYSIKDSEYKGMITNVRISYYPN
jgi:hypothetical protein